MFIPVLVLNSTRIGLKISLRYWRVSELIFGWFLALFFPIQFSLVNLKQGKPFRPAQHRVNKKSHLSCPPLRLDSTEILKTF